MVADPIEHVVVLMLENRSFDQMLGDLSEVHPALNGISKPPKSLNCALGAFDQQPTEVFSGPRDPLHEFTNVNDQLKAGGTGFLTDYCDTHPNATAAEAKQVMGYFALDRLPALHALARNFTVCDRWHASVPGPTWPNRLFVHSGTSLGRVLMPSGLSDILKTWRWYTQTTIYDRLHAARKPWKIYRDGIPQSMVLMSLHKANIGGSWFEMGDFFEDVKDEGSFPAYSFIEPCYSTARQNDDHPPVDVRHGQALIANVYNALRANEELWKKSMLIVLYDEHGGFYDHQGTPDAAAPDGNAGDGFDFKRLGLRVPAVIASPWVKAGVCDTLFDHTSILKYLIDKWSLGPLGERTRNANSIAEVIEPQMRTDTPATIPGADEAPAPAQPSDLPQYEFQEQLVALSYAAEEQVMGLELETAPTPSLRAAEERVDRAIAEMKRRVGPFAMHPTAGDLLRDEADRRDDERPQLEGLFGPSPWEHAQHLFGYIAPGQLPAGPLEIVDARSIAGDRDLIGKPLKIALDLLYVHQYPGSGEHQVMVSFSAEHADGAGTQPLQFNQMFRTRDGEAAGVVNYPIFVGVRPAAIGLSFRAFTVNVRNKDDERALDFLKSEPFTKGLELASAAAGALAPLTKLGVGLTQLLLARNRNVPVQDIFLGLDFSDSPAGARLRTGSYLAIQMAPRDLEAWSWKNWRYDPARGLVSTGGEKARWNYFVFSVSAL